MKIAKHIVSIFLVVAITISVVIATDYETETTPNDKVYTQTFQDVPTDHWAFQYIEELVECGVISGYPDGTYQPDRIVSREEFAKIMVLASGLKTLQVSISKYEDVPLDHWASAYIETASPYLTAYQSGSTLLFKPTDGALREDMAVALVKLKGYDTAAADLGLLQTMFSDVNTISTSAQPYVALAVDHGIISGYTDGTFRGQKTITRAEAAAILVRAFQYGDDSKIVVDDTEITPSTTEPSAAISTEQNSEFSHTMDTVATGLTKFRTMILTNSGEVYYINGTTLTSTGSSQTLNILTDLSYTLKKDNKNKDFSLYSPYLAYDSNKDIIYLLGNEGGLTNGNMVVYDVTDLSNPVAVMSSDLLGASDTLLPRLEYETDTRPDDVFVLSNGVILVPCHDGKTYMVSPSQGTATVFAKSLVAYRRSTYGLIINDKIVMVDRLYNAMEITPISASNSETTISIDGEIPTNQYTCAGPGGIYFWSNSEGLLYIDLEGWRRTAVPVDQVECVDLVPFPNNVWKICVNNNTDCAIYDDTSKSIRLLTGK